MLETSVRRTPNHQICGQVSRAMCDGIVLNGKSITTVGQAEAVFGKDAIEWNTWCEDSYACENSPREGFGPHAPKPTDCFCYIDIVATARRSGYDFHYLPSDQ